MEKKLLERYEITSEIGQGGMAVVYKGVDSLLGREVAIKILHPHLSQKGEAKMRFFREAHAIAKLHHPNILEIYDFSGMEADRNFIITEYIKGKSLRQFIDERRIELPEISAMIVCEVADALSHAHNLGIIHRDVKPENIMVREDGVLKLMDFGIAQMVDMQHLTITGAIVGSPAHMSPEHIEGKNLDFRADIFSLGTLFYLLSTGKYPFIGTTPHALLKNILEANWEDPRCHNRYISDEIHQIISKMLKRNPDERYQKAEDVKKDIISYLEKYNIYSVHEECKKYFANPDSYENELKENLNKYHLEQGCFFIKSKKYFDAIIHLNRVLNFDEKNEVAIKYLKEIERKSKRKAIIKYFLYGSATAILLSLFIFNFSLIKEKILPEKKEEGTIANKLSIFLAIRDEESLIAFSRRGIEEINFSPSLRKKIPPTKKIPPSGAERKIPVTIFANPPAVQIFIDNIPSGFGTTGNIGLSEGEHIIKLLHPDCSICMETTYRLAIDVKNPPKAPIRYSIRYKDAVLLVKSEIKNGKVFVNGILRGETGENIKIPLNSPQEIKSMIKVVKDGYDPQILETKLSPGVFKQLDVNLKKK